MFLTVLGIFPLSYQANAQWQKEVGKAVGGYVAEKIVDKVVDKVKEGNEADRQAREKLAKERRENEAGRPRESPGMSRSDREITRKERQLESTGHHNSRADRI